MRLRCCNRRLVPAGCSVGWHGRVQMAVGAEQVSAALRLVAPVHSEPLFCGETLVAPAVAERNKCKGVIQYQSEYKDTPK